MRSYLLLLGFVASCVSEPEAEACDHLRCSNGCFELMSGEQLCSYWRRYCLNRPYRDQPDCCEEAVMNLPTGCPERPLE